MVVRLEGEINGESVVLYRNKDSPGSPEIWGCSYSSDIKRQVCDRTYRL